MKIIDVVLLTAEEELVLGRRIQASPGTPDAIAARNELVERNIPLVGWVIDKKMGGSRPGEREDDEQAGCVGLLRAAEKFDPDQFGRFTGYAVYWIRQQIRADQIQRAIIRLPRDLHRSDAKLTPAERAAKAATPKRAGDYELTICASPAPESPQPPEITLADAVARLLGECHLGQREASILADIYGLGGRPRLTLNQCGRRLGITRERVRQIRDAALITIRRRVRDPESYLEAI